MAAHSRGRDSILDTQIISYAMKGAWPRGVAPLDISGARISSVTAHELLEVSSGNHPNYYLYAPLVPEIIGEQVSRSFDRAHRRMKFAPKHRTDQVILDFGSDFPTLIEYGHLMIGWLLKYKRTDAYVRRIGHLDKRDRRRLTDIFEYLVDNDLSCVSLDRNKAQLGIELLHEYGASGNSLKADFHNSLNDMLILATAVEATANLITEDRTLWRFAAGILDIPVRTTETMIRLDVSPGVAKSVISRESKGYINRPWQARVRSRNIPSRSG